MGLKLLADRDERFKGLFVKVSIFVLLAVAGVALNLLFSGIKKGIFSPKVSIHFVADSGQDIKEGMPVKLSGFKIGSVKNIELDNMAQADVELVIEKQYLPLLDGDATVTLKKEGIIGDSILEARRGTESSGSLQPGATIRFERGGGLDQIAQDLRDRLFPALDEVNKLLHDANDPQGDVRQTLKNLRGTSAKMDSVLGQVDEGIAKDLRPMLRSARQAAESAESMTGKLDKNMPAMVNKVDTTLENLRQTSETLKSAVTDAAPQLPGVMRDSRGLISDTRNIEDSLSASWPLKNIMSPPEQGLLRMDSHD